MNYSIFDPTGNITALVESPVDPSRQPEAAAEIMRKHPVVEQVGFVSLKGDVPALRMAGGEFCGNAAMSAAALFAIERNLAVPTTVTLSVSGAEQPVAVRIMQREGESFRAAVAMPRALSVQQRSFVHDILQGELTVVQLEGISHVLIEPASPFFSLLSDRAAAEQAVRCWCGELCADGLGLMFVSEHALLPLVFVPGSGTVFWETSCASGTAAVGMAIAASSAQPVDRTFSEPGGSLCVFSDPASGQIWLQGGTRRTEQDLEA